MTAPGRGAGERVSKRALSTLIVILVVAICLSLRSVVGPEVSTPRTRESSSSVDWVDYDTHRKDLPFIFLFRGKSLSYDKLTLKSGVLVSVWPDGTIVRATSRENIGRAHVHGQLSPEVLSGLTDELRSTNILLTQTEAIQPPPLDGEFETLVVRLKGFHRTWMHSPIWRPDPQLLKIRQLLMDLAIADSRLVNDPETYSQYPDDWFTE